MKLKPYILNYPHRNECSFIYKKVKLQGPMTRYLILSREPPYLYEIQNPHQTFWGGVYTPGKGLGDTKTWFILNSMFGIHPS